VIFFSIKIALNIRRPSFLINMGSSSAGLTILAAVIIQLALIKSPKVHDHFVIVGPLAGLAITYIAQMKGAYSEWCGHKLFASISKVISSWIMSWLLVASFAFEIEMSELFSQEVWLIWLGITRVVMFLYRIVIPHCYVSKVSANKTFLSLVRAHWD
jgi:hypothetical protein